MKLNWQRAFGFSGRMGRLRYFMHSIIDVLIIIAIICGVILLEAKFDYEISDGALMTALWATIILGMLAEIRATVKRFHDIGKSGWSFFLLMIPFVNIYYSFVLMFKPGDVGANEFGERT